MIAAIDFVSIFCDSFALYSFVRAQTPVAYGRVVRAQAGGMAINRLTPGNSLGEPVKMTLLADDVPSHVAVSAVLMFNVMTMYIAITAVVVGVPITALLLDLPRDVAIAVWIASAGLIAIALAVGILLRRGAIATLVNVLARLHLISRTRAGAWCAKIADIDAQLQALGRGRSGGLARGFAGVFASRVCNWCGTLAILAAADVPMTPALVVAMLSVGILVTWISNVIPLGLGIADTSNYALYDLVGTSPAAGLVFTMVNRIRTVMLAVMALAIMALANVMRHHARKTSV